ncbi:hypothetical protein QEN19_002964 [Hanseniaspora menglaensis]
MTEIKLKYSKDFVFDYNNDIVKESMLLFLQEFIVIGDGTNNVNFKSIIEKISETTSNKIFDFRISIDPVGNNALHWLSKLSLVDVIRDIFDMKSENILFDDCIVNNNSETCLVECVKSINSFNSKNFEEMLFFFDNIVLCNDNINNRNLLQSICFNYNENASEYYLKKVLEHVSKHHNSNVFKAFINNKDVDGDTCLNIASKLNLYSLIEILLASGADPFIENMRNIKPSDYGVSHLNSQSESTNDMEFNFNTPISLINNTIEDVNTTYIKDTASFTEMLKKLKADIEIKKQEVHKLKSRVDKIDLKNYDSFKNFTFLNNGLVKQRELLDKQLETFPEFRNFINTSEGYEGKLPIPLVSDELLNIIDEQDSLANNTFDINRILSKLEQNNLNNELDSISVEQIDTLIDTYTQQNNSIMQLYEEMREHKKRRLTKYRTLIAKTLDMNVEDADEIDLLVDGICKDI